MSCAPGFIAARAAAEMRWRVSSDVLFAAPWGLAPPGAPPREGSDGHGFLANYQGGWQELAPNTNDPCTVDAPGPETQASRRAVERSRQPASRSAHHR